MAPYWIQTPPGVRTVSVRFFERFTNNHHVIPTFRRYAFPWVSIRNTNLPAVFFHNKPWSSQEEASDMAQIYIAPACFCHVIDRRQVCLGKDYNLHKGLTIPEIFWFTTFTDVEGLYTDKNSPAKPTRRLAREFEQLRVMRDIEHPDRVLTLDWNWYYE